MPDFGALFGGLSGQAKAYTPDGQASIQDKLQAQKKSTLEDFLKQTSGVAGKAGGGSKGKSQVETEIENQKKVLQLQEKQLQLTKQNLQAQQDSAQTQIQNEITNSQNQLNTLKLQKEAKTITDEEFDKQELVLKTNLENKKQSLDLLKQQQASQIDQLEAKALELNKKQLDLDIKQFGSDISGQTGDKNLTINGVNINNTSDLDQFSQLLKNALA
jgi:chromosome segregation ATPase